MKRTLASLAISTLAFAAVHALAKGDVVWAAEATNPGSVLRRCTIRNSCRFQTAVTLHVLALHACLRLVSLRVLRVTIR